MTLFSWSLSETKQERKKFAAHEIPALPASGWCESPEIQTCEHVHEPKRSHLSPSTNSTEWKWNHFTAFADCLVFVQLSHWNALKLSHSHCLRDLKWAFLLGQSAAWGLEESTQSAWHHSNRSHLVTRRGGYRGYRGVLADKAPSETYSCVAMWTTSAAVSRSWD